MCDARSCRASDLSDLAFSTGRGPAAAVDIAAAPTDPVGVVVGPDGILYECTYHIERQQCVCVEFIT